MHESSVDVGSPFSRELPPNIGGVLFDLDGVLTSTAEVHAAAWTEAFDAFLASQSTEDRPLAPFSHDDYLTYVDGRPRRDGVRAFLASRLIVLPEGERSDGGDVLSVNGLARRKNELLLHRLQVQGAKAFPSSRPYIEAMRAAGIACGVVSSSENAIPVLEATGLRELVDIVVDGVVADQETLAGKPLPDTFLYGARLLELDPSDVAVFEDAVAGVKAGRAGGFGWVVGIDRAGHRDELLAGGADIVVIDLGELAFPPAKLRTS